jgi:hypothetical protein
MEKVGGYRYPPGSLLLFPPCINMIVFDKYSTVFYDCGDAQRVVDSTHDSVGVGLNDSFITRMDRNSSSYPPIIWYLHDSD